MFELNEIERDALTEVFNIGVGQAAATMSQMVHEEVLLSAPRFIFTSRAAAAANLSKDVGKRICGVSQRFQGTFDANAILMFPESKSLEIVRLMIGDHIPLEELTDMEQEALSEIGNIILNSLIGSFADLLGCEFFCSMPVFHLGTGSEILQVGEGGGDAAVLLLHIDFNLERHAITGYVAFLLDVTSMHGLKDSIDRFIRNIGHLGQ